jgi:formamidopyrimidine-DNA glycosylase
MGDNGDSRLDSLGPEATTISSRTLHAVLQGSRRPVKSLLLDQTRIAGLGNIYVDESLHRARIHPAQSAATLSREQAGRLCRAIHLVLRQAIKHMGTTFDSYRGADGRPGGFAKRLRVYNNVGGKCRFCGVGIAKIKLGGRGTHYCPGCQRLPKASVG